ncbi:hypothetical protein PPIS_a0984 [Pseudoalteromonas piscicida]|uniref:Uncharacterized protein n=1 Tax=Pseudoalteromonas piscicida TaxID=43662 RepID=A0ABN5CFS3_PSEO7|nr:hypothetical protein PPIS_a0984 [Pseudoalteromonas piscicida]
MLDIDVFQRADSAINAYFRAHISGAWYSDNIASRSFTSAE